MNKSRFRGFTLMELMIAAAILVIVLVGLLATFAGSFGLIRSSKNLTTAISHARCVMEKMRDYNIPSFIVVEDWPSWAQTAPPDGGGCNSLDSESIQITYPSGETARPLEIVVTVNWTEKSRQRSVQLATLLTER